MKIIAWPKWYANALIHSLVNTLCFKCLLKCLLKPCNFRSESWGQIRLLCVNIIVCGRKTPHNTVSSLNSFKLWSQPVCSLFMFLLFLEENLVTWMTWRIAYHKFFFWTLQSGWQTENSAMTQLPGWQPAAKWLKFKNFLENLLQIYEHFQKGNLKPQL